MPFDPEVVCRIFYQTCKAVSHMHSQNPKIIHRDLKIENLLISSDGNIKLCDFGSATIEVHQPDLTWSANQRSTLEDQVNMKNVMQITNSAFLFSDGSFYHTDVSSSGNGRHLEQLLRWPSCRHLGTRLHSVHPLLHETPFRRQR